MTTEKSSASKPVRHDAPPRHTSSAMKNTAKCVLVLGVIAVVCVTLLAVANRFLQVEVTLDKTTSNLINRIAPTGVDDDTAFSGGYIKMVRLQDGAFAITDLDAYNKEHGTATQKVRALYTSTDTAGKTTYVVEAEGKGYVDAVVMLVAYDADNKVSGVVTKSHSESYWNHIKNEEALYAAFVGTSGKVGSSSIAASTGVTVMGTLGGMTSAVSIANDFITRLGGAPQKPAPYTVTDSVVLKRLQKVSNADEFTCYAVQTATVANMYVGNNGDVIAEATGDGGAYGNVTMFVRVEDGKVMRVTLAENSISPLPPDHDSSALQEDATLNALFVGKTLATLPSHLAGTTGVTQSASGLLAAVKNALTYAASFDPAAYTEVVA